MMRTNENINEADCNNEEKHGNGVNLSIRFIGNDFMYNDEIKMLREKNLTTIFSPNNRWEFCKSIPLCQFINIRDITLLWKIACKKVNTLSTKKEDCKFQVGCM